MGARTGDGQRLRPDRNQHVREHQRPADRGIRHTADRVAGRWGGAVRARRIAAAGAARRGGRTLRRRIRCGRRVSRATVPDRGPLRGVPVRGAGCADVSHRGPGALARRRAAGLPGPGRRAGQGPRLPHRAGRDPGGAVGAGRGGAGRRRRPRGQSRGQAAGRLHHRHRRPGRGPRAPGRAAARLHGPRRRAGARRNPVDPQRQTRRPRPARTRLRRRRVPRPRITDRGDPGRHLRRGAGRAAGRGRRLLLRPGRRQHLGDAPDRGRQRRPERRPAGAHRVRGAHGRRASAPDRGGRQRTRAVDGR
ncbi:hypothetical protein PICSAR11_04024 [Mycobacterium avium subsp. paratuberculosis]|nr:hypothetical protein PICSAR103_00190 [Mycobacterium avium subsp. paratuberculosis]CAG6852848.1 hypothetical protein PICSAR100_00192 [Mycobacterium avium subsp. paratuberculosis]CAG6875842.1 hypothetical protein PICSAR118_01426 [Mycobacterium avium subsp. paratuberculosis]CAG6926993.1 hypothetical protein PICSAR10_03915 [Mycobacterium avium subsp. paratuberculosis]CAG6927966.1 hypothetical protein PICSAR11_04024 [Mycobacterium avium subsp. paratuberculosis]